jgi:hypothetical protein
LDECDETTAAREENTFHNLFTGSVLEPRLDRGFNLLIFWVGSLLYGGRPSRHTTNFPPNKNIQDNYRLQTDKTISKTHVWQLFTHTQMKQLVKPHDLELIGGSYIREAGQHDSEQQIPSSQQPVHLMIAR